MRPMPTKTLKLRRREDGYYETSWVDDQRGRHKRTFGNHPRHARNAFNRFHARWRADSAVRNCTEIGSLTIREAWKLWEKYAGQHYRRADGSPTGEAANVAQAMNPVLELFVDLPVGEFGPKALKEARAVMIAGRLCVNVINARVRRIRHVFRWLVAEELVVPSVWHGLQALAPLQPGRTPAPVSTPVRPVPEEHIWAILPHVPPTVAAMIQVQFLTGMRSMELCTMRPICLDTTAPVWLYRPVQHKTQHIGRERVILLGPKAQQIIQPFLKRDVTAFLFSPREAQKQRFLECATHRHQPNRRPRTRRRVGDRYTSQAYGVCIARVCRNQGIPHWSPGQLRHNAATRLRQEFGLDVAQIILGHSRADVTEIYAAVNLKRAVAVMERVG